jgi:hypothetical protein
MPKILPTLEAEIRKIKIQDQPGKRVHETSTQLIKDGYGGESTSSYGGKHK